ncbi:uncharacterized protein LOC125064291 [Vanessa atalanta]|uniref:uncharacterized protein LOC125064291 n=1 Tax=Vanessa atalanta TaxID=42275 RepID=UPI001FCD73F3|nr:uncharacterized protein LOC125064291 [Vanessa atalanta]
MMDSTTERVFMGTAEIEAILNEIKHREIQMIAQHEPSISDLISSTVTETTFVSSYHPNDDYSMLSVFELLLTKTHENNMMNVLSTKNFPIKREIKSEKNIENTSKDKNNFQVIDYANIDYNFNGTTTYEQNDHYDVPEDTSFESLSNKISYNDYVNGFKYYLNRQKDPDDLRFSNFIRYQAHKHHKVDDIGKYILNKIPQLPTTRLKRKFVETETLDDQDISTKSEDSWFKKHFFIFLDKDTPKKFHSVQTSTGRQHIFDYEILSDINKSDRKKDKIKNKNNDNNEYENNRNSKYESESAFKIDDIMKQIPNISNDFTTKMNKYPENTEDDSTDKKTGIINTPPEQYFKTPIPMEMDEFNKFLRDENIDVLSVTSPLRDTVSKIVESRKSSSKKLSSYQMLDEDLKASTSNVKKKHNKRDLSDKKYFTAKDVAALEVIVDMMKSTPGLEGNKKTKEYSRSNKNNSYTPLLERENQLNSIQIHIAIPPNASDRRRSMDSVNFRKVFSAVLSTPVDLEYQILTFDETTIAPTTVMQNILSPGLYLLVENTNTTCPKGNYELKPLSLIETSNLNISHATITQSKAIDSMKNTKSLLLNKNPMKNYHNFTTVNDIKCKRNINMAHTSKNYNWRQKIAVKKRNIDFNAVKRFFGHDRVCRCRCKVNKPMCKSCAESDKVITELMIEFNNLEKYVTDHCTEVQTFFWMNPTGGKKLRSVIHRIDKCLKDYYKRVKGKCQGRTCQMISSNIDKRRDCDKRIGGQTRKFDVLSKLKRFTLKYLKNSSHTKRHQNHVNRAVIMPTLPKKYTVTTTLKYSEVRKDFLTDNTTPNSPTIIIFDDIPTSTNNHEYFDINCKK